MQTFNDSRHLAIDKTGQAIYRNDHSDSLDLTDKQGSWKYYLSDQVLTFTPNMALGGITPAMKMKNVA